MLIKCEIFSFSATMRIPKILTTRACFCHLCLVIKKVKKMKKKHLIGLWIYFSCTISMKIIKDFNAIFCTDGIARKEIL